MLLGQGKADEAIPIFQKVIQDEPNQAMAHQYLGVAFATKNEIAQALQELNEAVKLAPQDRTIRKALALVRMAEGSYTMAIEEAQVAIRLKSSRCTGCSFVGTGVSSAKRYFTSEKSLRSHCEANSARSCGPLPIGAD